MPRSTCSSNISRSATAISASWATTIRRSTAGAAPMCGTCSRSRTTFPARSSCDWSRITEARKSSSMPRTASSPRTRRASARHCLRRRRAASRAGSVNDLRPNVREALSGVAALVDRLREAVGQADPATALETILATTAYEQYLAEEGAEGMERIENVRELVAGAAAWAEVQDPEAAEGTGTPVERYLTQAALITPVDEDKNEPGVTLLTVHMAKGLEWPIVALAGLEDGLFPLGRSVEQPGGVEEERRLCYVGLTRARERLYLSWARTRYRNGRLELAEPSRFLAALPPQVVEERSTTASWRPLRSSGAMSPRPARPRGAAALRLLPDLGFPEEASQDAPRYVKGERVRHRKFGGGIVRAVSGAGRDLRVSVDFDDPDIGTKQLLVAYAGLERDWEGDGA